MSLRDFRASEFSRRAEFGNLRGQFRHFPFNTRIIAAFEVAHLSECLDATHFKFNVHGVVDGVFERCHDILRGVDGVLEVIVGVE